MQSDLNADLWRTWAQIYCGKVHGLYIVHVNKSCDCMSRVFFLFSTYYSSSVDPISSQVSTIIITIVSGAEIQ